MKELIITFRESLEAALIVGIIYTFLVKTDRKNLLPKVWMGVGASVIASLAVAAVLYFVSKAVNDTVYNTLFEAVMMFIAAGFLIYMIVWMAKNVAIKKELEDGVSSASEWGIFFLVFTAILREGFETALFLFAGRSINEQFSYLGFFGGIALALGLAYLLFVQGRRIALKPFFNVSSVLLILFAAGMVAYGTHEAEEFLEDAYDIEAPARAWAILKPLTEAPVEADAWAYTQVGEKYYHFLHEKGTVGVFFKGLFGFNSDPSWPEFLLWLATLLGTGWLWLKATRPTTKTA